MRETREDEAIEMYHKVCMWVGKLFFGTLVALSGAIVLFGSAAVIEYFSK